MRYIKKARCQSCGEPHWFRYWVGEYCEASKHGLSVTDCDMVFHRFKRVQDKIGVRDVEHLMIVEIKTGDERLSKPQRDTLTHCNQLFNEIIPINGVPINVKARPGMIVPKNKKITWHGIHLLRVPVIEDHNGPFFWDNKPIDPLTLIKVLNFENDPRHPARRLDVDRRHKAGGDNALQGYLFQ